MAASRRDRIRYRSDRIMSAGVKAQIAALAVLTIIVIAFVFVVILLANLKSGGYHKPTGLYHLLLEVIDSGTVGNFTSPSWVYTLLAVLITIYGLFVVGSLIGILANGLDERIQNLRKGRSRVVENGHIVVLGWSDQIFALLAEIALANENQKRSAVVVMAPNDKVEMEDAIRAKVRYGKQTRMVCRTGNPLDIDDLGLLSLATSKAVIILTPETEPDPDSLVLKSLMALMSAAGDAQGFQVFAELHDEANAHVAQLAGRGRVQLVPGQTFTARIVAETASQPGLSAVFTELLDYGGDEIYISTLPELTGTAFGDCLQRFEDSVPIGIATAAGEIQVNPPMETMLANGDRLIAISEDDDTVVTNGQPEIDEAVIRTSQRVPPGPGRTLILGENPQLHVIAEELERRAPEGSELVVASGTDGHIAAEVGALLQRQSVSHRRMNTTSRAELEKLDPASFDRVVILTNPALPPEQADARTLTTLLHVRDLEQQSKRNIPVVSEMKLPQNKALAEASTDYDFVVSTQLISLYISQVVMTPALSDVFRALLTGDSSLIEMAPAGGYVETGVPVNFYTVTESARRQGHIALGYRRRGERGPAEVVVNPDKSATQVFGPGDQIVILSAPTVPAAAAVQTTPAATTA